MASDKALSKAELELTQRAQMFFPRGDIAPDIVNAWNGCPKELITERMIIAFGQMPKISALLKRISNITVELETGTFIASDRFQVDTGSKAVVKISFLGDNFRQWMLNKQEQPPASAHLCCYELLKASVDESIINELGGEQKVETLLCEIFALMKKQRNGEKGDLLTDGRANIFYVRDVNNVLLKVFVRWFVDGWSLNAYPVERSCRWRAGYRVFSCNSNSLES